MKKILLMLIIIIMILPVGCSAKETAKNSQSFRGKTIEEVLAKSGRNIFFILHEEDVENGVLVFYLPDIKGETEAASELGVEYLKKNPGGFEMSYRGGAYSSGIDQKLYAEFFPDDGDKSSPLPLFYGEIKDQNIKQVSVTDLGSQVEKKAKVIQLDSKPGMKSAMSIWYVSLTKPAGTKFEIEGLTEKGEVIYSQTIDVEQQSASKTVKIFYK